MALFMDKINTDLKSKKRYPKFTVHDKMVISTNIENADTQGFPNDFKGGDGCEVHDTVYTTEENQT